jgi:multiple sugar transport system substrate-binding protein
MAQFELDPLTTPREVGPMSRCAVPVVALVVAGLVLAGCQDAPRKEGPARLVFKHARILGGDNPIPELLREFEARHPGVSVVSEVLPWNADEQHQFYVINLEGGRAGFDVLMMDVIWVPEFARAGWLLDLAPSFPVEERAAFFPSAIEVASQAGGIWGIPWNMNVGLLYYRADLLARHGLAAPRTWDELVAQVRRIRAAELPGLDGFLWQGKQYEGLVVNTLEHLWADGTALLGPGDTVFPDPARAEEVLQFMRGLLTAGISPPWTTAADEELGRRAFGDGRAIFYRGWPYALDLFELPDSPVRGKVGVAPLPRHRHGAASPGSTGGSHLGVYRHTRHPEAAVALARFLTGEDAQRRIARAALWPTRMRLYEEPAFAGRTGVREIYAMMLAARPRPITPYYLTLSTTVQPELSAALVGVKSPAASVRDARHQLGYLLAPFAQQRAGARGPFARSDR